MRFDSGATPLPILLRGTCFYCHTGLNTTASLLTSPPRVMGTGAGPTYTPITGGAGAAGTSLGGGDFFWVGTNDSFGHNVNGLINADGTLANTPPGGVALGAQLECAGTNGCHGDPAVLAPLSSLSGAHHSIHNGPTNSLAEIDGTTIGKSFRYLDGVLGIEDTDWQHTESTTDHNVYYGVQRTNDLATANTATISGLCARCHGAFHNVVDGAGAGDTYGINTSNNSFAGGEWTRHPTDYSMPLTGEYSNFVTYQPETPVGKDTLANASDAVGTANDRIVLCVSCHRAHGSPYADALRWSYGQMDVGGGATHGCMNCHTAKG